MKTHKKTTPLRKYGGKEKTQGLPCICCMYKQQTQGSLHVFFFSTIFRSGVFILFIGSSLHLKIFYKNAIYKYCSNLTSFNSQVAILFMKPSHSKLCTFTTTPLTFFQVQERLCPGDLLVTQLFLLCKFFNTS